MTPIYDQTVKAAKRRHAIHRFTHSPFLSDAAALLLGLAFLGLVWAAFVLWTVR